MITKNLCNKNCLISKNHSEKDLSLDIQKHLKCNEEKIQFRAKISFQFSLIVNEIYI